MKIESYEFHGEGMGKVYANDSWMVGLKNWKPANDITGVDCLERHNLTDELFVLLAGECTLVYANETPNGLEIDAVKMEPYYKVYNVPATLWHNTVTQRDTKLVLFEDSSTSMENSDVLPLSEEQIAKIRELVK